VRNFTYSNLAITEHLILCSSINIVSEKPEITQETPSHYDRVSKLFDDSSTKASSGIRASCIGFSSPKLKKSSNPKNRRITNGPKGVNRKLMFNLDQDSLVKEIQKDAQYFTTEEEDEDFECYENLIPELHEDITPRRKGGRRKKKLDFEVIDETDAEHKYKQNSTFQGPTSKKSVKEMEDEMMEGPSRPGRLRLASSYTTCTIMGNHPEVKKDENKFCCQLI